MARRVNSFFFFFPGGKVDFNLETNKFQNYVKKAYSVNMYANKGDFTYDALCTCLLE